jgi:CelD/BcsL family acetyltransferase involved in cellulose biosynthesis
MRWGHDLVGVAPLFFWGSPERTLSLLGAAISDYLDVLAAPGCEGSVLEGFSDWLEQAPGGWDACVFDEIGPSALLRNMRCPRGRVAKSEPQSVCPVLAFPDGAIDVERVVPIRQAAALRKSRRRATRVGALEFERADRGEPNRALEHLFALHARRWESQGQRGLMGGDDLRGLHKEVAEAFAARGALRLYLLRVGGRLASVIYGFRERRRIYLYMQGFEPALALVGPGTLLVGALLEDALSEGIAAVDFLRGSEAYKYAWGARDQLNARIRIEGAGR